MESNVAELIVILKRGDSLARRHAAQELGRIGPPAAEAIPALLAVLKGDEDYRVRDHAASALEEALNDHNYHVREVALYALKKIAADVV